MRKLKLTGPIFAELLDQLEKKCKEILKENNDDWELPQSKGPEYFGFKPYDNFDNSIKGIMTRDKDVIKFLLSSKDRKGRPIQQKDISNAINGKLLYNKYLEYSSNPNKSIFFTGIYTKVFFIFLGHKDFNAFLRSNRNISNAEKSIQSAIQSQEYISELASRFIGRYFSYHDNRVKHFVLEIDPYNSMHARQTGFHSVHDSTSFHSGTDMTISLNKIYEGIAEDQGAILYLSLKSTSREQGRNMYMSLFLYMGGRSIDNLDMIRGVLTTQSIHGYIFSGEIVLQRVAKNDHTDDLVRYGFLENSTASIVIKRYLMMQRKTLKIARRTIQKHTELVAKKYRINMLESMIGIWKIWGVDAKGRIMQSSLEIKTDYTAHLMTNSTDRDEKQVCIFRIARGSSSNNLWISAHQQEGIELKNVAVIHIPDGARKKTYLTKGCACGLGVFKATFALTPIVLLKVKSTKFKVGKLDKGDLTKILSSNTPSITALRHRELYQLLEEVLEEHRVQITHPKTKFASFEELARENSGYRGYE